ncbi:MAG: hypothetical protein BWX62_00815 [Bacteroidetes bacterium ADurb.Bin037]|nr:MAG: hypothetical protein BWX62_00815 [Bacteroidetes bacterium ADurb.Bin037]
MTILDITLQPLYDILAAIWAFIFQGAGAWANDLYVILNKIFDIFQNIFTFVIREVTPVV